MIAPELQARRTVVAELTLLTTLDVADILGVPNRSVLRLIRSGDLRPTKTIGKSDFRFSRDDLRRWIESNGHQGTHSAASESEPKSEVVRG